MKTYLFTAIALLGLLYGCKPEVTLPKPRGYFKLDLPETHTYTKFDSAGFPFTFEYPKYGHIIQDTNLIKEENQPYWINVSVPQLNAMVYLSYKAIRPGVSLNGLVQESYKLTNAHNTKADFIEAPNFTTPSGLRGVFYTVGGNAASAYQFYVTDNKANFIRGSLYFNSQPNADSIAPAAEFLKKDIEHMINTLQFR
ncbi:MAG: hypothetical protein EOP54_10920 [Sphingobacteriales bacterium]|nr:MAG: hypothetical protein EOP54_10920 [Sphingobacteriales bacterium]